MKQRFILVAVLSARCSHSLAAPVSWGWFDFRRQGESLEEGYPSPPVNWGLRSDRKRAFCQYLAEITEAKQP